MINLHLVTLTRCDMTNREGDRIARHLPLKPVLFWILLVLVDGVRHGYGILKEIEARTDGGVRLEPGNLYRYVKRLLDDGLIDEVDPPSEQDSADERRRYYGVTALGRDVVRAEAERMKRLVAAAESRNLVGPDGATP